MRRLTALVAACAAALFVPLLLPLLTHRVYTLDDLGSYNVPMRFVYAEALGRGDSILWTPSVFGGFSVFGESQLGMAHPWHLLLYRFLPLASAVNIEILASYVALFAGMLLLLKHAGLTVESRWFGAMVFTFSGYNLYHLIHVNIIGVVAHIPWVILTAHILATAENRQTRARAFAALALLFASQILVGQPQHVWLGLLTLVAMTLYVVWNNAPLAGLVYVGGALVTGILVAGIQILPMMDVVRASERAAWSSADSLSFSLAPIDIVQLWLPFAFHDRPTIETLSLHEFIIYNGAFCTTAMAWIGVRRRALERGRLVVLLLLFAAVAVLLALGKYVGLYTLMLEVPGMHWFRAPSRHLVLYHLSISVVAAIVFEDLLALVRRGPQIAWRRLWPLAIPALLSVATAIVLSRMSGWRGYQFSSLVESGPWVLVLLAVTLLFALTARGVRWALPLLVIVAAADQGYFGFQYVFSDPNQPLQTVAALAARAPVPPEAQPGDLLEAYQGYGLANVPVLRGFRVWPGYVGLSPRLTLPRQSRDLVTERVAGVKWRLTRYPIMEPVPDPAPRARLLTAARVSTNIPADVRRIDILNEALVAEPVEDLTGPPGSVRIIEDRPGRITVETTTSGRQLLALTERFDPGWQIAEDAIQGASAAHSSIRPLRVYGDFLGGVVDAGVHRVVFEFRPRSVEYGLILTGIGLLMVACVVPLAFWKRTEDLGALRN